MKKYIPLLVCIFHYNNELYSNHIPSPKNLENLEKRVKESQNLTIHQKKILAQQVTIASLYTLLNIIKKTETKAHLLLAQNNDRKAACELLAAITPTKKETVLALAHEKKKLVKTKVQEDQSLPRNRFC